MPDEDDRTAAALLLHELREGADPDVDDEALSRVRQRLYSLKSPRLLRPAVSKRSGWMQGARGGLAAALLVGTALGAGGHAFVSYVIVPRAAYQVPMHVERSHAVAMPNPVLPLPVAPSVNAEAPGAIPVASTYRVTMPGLSVPSSVLPQRALSAAAPPNLDTELRELEAARHEVAAGNSSGALQALRDHAQRYPQSMLAQEREALTIKALVAAGRSAEAHTLADRFAASYPSSMLLDSVKSSVRSIP